MDKRIHTFLENYFAEHGFSKAHENVRYVEHNFVEQDYMEEKRRLVSGEIKAVFKIAAWFTVQEIEPLVEGGILVLADRFGEAFAVVKIVGIDTIKYNQVTEQLAKQFCIGNRSLQSWKDMNADFLNTECEHQKIDFNDETELLITWIDVIFPTDK